MRRMSAAQFTASVVVPVPPLVPRKLTIMQRVEATPVPERAMRDRHRENRDLAARSRRRATCTNVSGRTRIVRASRHARPRSPARPLTLSRANTMSWRDRASACASRHVTCSEPGCSCGAPGKTMATTNSRSLARPAKDEWGVYDPQQAGLAALFARLDAKDTNAPAPAGAGEERNGGLPGPGAAGVSRRITATVAPRSSTSLPRGDPQGSPDFFVPPASPRARRANVS